MPRTTGRIVTGSHDHTARVWDAENGKELFPLRGHSDFINSVAFSPDGQRIVTGSYDGTAIIWDAMSGSSLSTLPGSIPAITAQHAAYVSGGEGELTLRGRSAAIRSVAFSRDSQRLITGSQDGSVTVWEAASGKQLLTVKGHSRPIGSVAFSPDGRRIITGSYDKTAKLWEAASGEELLTLAGHEGWITSAVFSPDGQRIVTASGDTAKVWQAATLKEVAAWQQEEMAAAGRLESVRRQQVAAAERNRALRAQDPGMIKQWLLLAPIAFEGTNGAVALDHEQIPHEAALRPRAGERVQSGQSERAWKTVQLEDYLLDLKQLVGEAIELSVAYAACYIQSDVGRADLVMKVGSDDRAKVYLNGREIHRRSNVRTYIADQDAVSGVELKAGINVLVFKVVHQTMGSQGSIRLTDAADQPLKGIKVTLDPD